MSFIKQLLRDEGLIPAENTQDPPAQDPPAQDPPTQDPPAQDPPAQDPLTPEPPAQDPPAQDPPTPEPPAQDPPANISSLDVDDAKLLEALKKRGINVNSFDELKPKPEADPAKPKDPEDVSEDEALSFVLEQKEVDPAIVEQYKADKSKDPEVLARELYKQDRQRENREKHGEAAAQLSDEVLDREFDDMYFTYEDEDSPLRKKGLRDMQEMVEDYLGSSYQKVVTAKDRLKEHRATQKITTEYQSAVSEAISELEKPLVFTIKDENDQDQTFQFKPTPDLLNKVKEAFAQSEEPWELFRQNDSLDKDSLKTAFKSTLLQTTLEQIVSEVAKSYADKKVQEVLKGRRGIPTVGANGSLVPDTSGGSKTPYIKQAIKEAQGS